MLCISPSYDPSLINSLTGRGGVRMMGSRMLVSRGQTAISAQGVYRLQYKRPRRKGSGRLHSADWV